MGSIGRGISSIFGGAAKKVAETQNTPAPKVENEKAADGESTRKKLVRGLLINTSPLGDLSPANIGRRKLLGN